MSSIVMGSVLGLLIGILVVMVLVLVFECGEPIVWLIIVAVAGGIVGGIIGGSIDKHFYESYVSEYSIAKDTIENSVTNDGLSGFEKAELVKQAVEENKTLTKYQYKAKQWYGFTVTDEILELEPIKLGGSDG